MNQPKVSFVGLNLCGDIKELDDEKVFEFTVLDIPETQTESIENFDIFSSGIHFIIILNEKLIIKSSLLLENEKTLEFKDVIKKVCATNEKCLILLRNGSLFVYNFIETQLEPQIILPDDEKAMDISCTYESNFAITYTNSLYKNSVRIHQFPKHQNIKKLVSGAEHSLALTSNGDIMSWGCGLRGQLGHGDINSIEIPTLIEALAGIKIIDIGAGGFHSTAVSAFGDLYCWGWNTNGQLGITRVTKLTFENLPTNHQVVFTLPQIVDIESENDQESVKRVYCGHKHTLVQTESNKLYSSGLNNYGQLGLNNDGTEICKFKEMNKDVDVNTKLVCGYWNTFLIN
ncbi:unnamed protein product [Diamesa tonsa]